MARSWSRREKLFLFAGLGAAALYVLSRWFLLPFLQFTAGADEEIEEGIAVLAAYQGVVSREESLRAEDLALDGAFEEYRSSFLPGETPPLAGAALEATLKGMAETAGLNIVSGKMLSHQKKTPFVEIPIQIVATGSVEGFRDFILLAESSEVYIGIRQLTIRSLSARQPQRPGTRGRAGGAEIQATMTVTGLIPS